MKKNEYVSPEMEIVEFTEQGCLLQTISGDGPVIKDDPDEEIDM